MITAHLVAATLASLAHLLRHAPTARDEQQVTLEYLAQLAGSDAPLVIVAGLESLTINETDVPIDAPGASTLNELMLLHGIRRVEFAVPLVGERVLGLCTVLAAFPGTFESFAEVEQAAGAGIGTGLSLAEASSELTFERFIPGMGLLSTPDPQSATGRESGIHLAEDGGLVHYTELDDLTELGTVDQLHYQRISVDPLGAPAEDFGEELTTILDRGRRAGRTEQWEDLLRAALDLLALEADATTEAAGMAIRLELRRMLPKPYLYQLARLAASGGRKQDAIAILRKVGADATEVLMDLLVDEISMAGRRGFYSALTHMSEGHDVIIAHLQHQTWYVVRNAAELCGEMDLERAVPELVKQIGHEDERVRRSVAGALAKIGTAATMEPLRRLLTDPAAPVRLRAVTALNPRRTRGIVMPLAAMLEKESEPEVIKAAALALARIGTPDALQALIAYAGAGPRRLFGLGGRPAGHRAWAVEALGRAGSAAETLIHPFLDDPAEEVRAAAQLALDSLGESAPLSGE